MHSVSGRRENWARGRALGLTGIMALLLMVAAACQDSSSPGNDGRARGNTKSAKSVRTSEELPVVIEVFAPESDHFAGINGVGWFVDLALEFEGNITSIGFTGNQLTGPGVHNNVAPMPGTFTPGKDDRFGGLVVLFTTTTLGAKSCQNLANLFNLTGPTNVEDDETEIWDTWILPAVVRGAYGKHDVCRRGAGPESRRDSQRCSGRDTGRQS